MTSPDDPMAAIRAQEEALAAATWSPLAQVDGVETAQVMGMTTVRAVGSSGPVLWFGDTEWQHFEGGDQDILATIQALVA